MHAVVQLGCSAQLHYIKQVFQADCALNTPNMQLGNQLPDLAVGDAAEQPLEKLSHLAYVQCAFSCVVIDSKQVTQLLLPLLDSSA